MSDDREKILNSYSWIKVKNRHKEKEDSADCDWKEEYKSLLLHHKEETEFLISKVRELMSRQKRKVTYESVVDSGLPENEGLYTVQGTVTVEFATEKEIEEKLKKYIPTRHKSGGAIVEVFELEWEFAEEETVI